jgi:hypothetical protein
LFLIVGREVEMSSRKLGLATFGAMGFGTYLLAGAMAVPAAGQPIPDGVADGLRGGATTGGWTCATGSLQPCPGGGGVGCTASGSTVQAGTHKFEASGSNKCSASCGGFWSKIQAGCGG